MNNELRQKRQELFNPLKKDFKTSYFAGEIERLQKEKESRDNQIERERERVAMIGLTEEEQAKLCVKFPTLAEMLGSFY